MDSEMVDFKYANSLYRPSYVLTDRSNNVNISFQQQNEFPDGVQPESFPNQQVALRKKSMPEAEWVDQGMKNINGRQFVFFKLLSDAYSQRIYGYFLITTFHDHPLIICFNCTEVLLPKWKNVAECIADSIVIRE